VRRRSSAETTLRVPPQQAVLQMTLQVSVSPPFWRWAVEDDEPKSGTEDELIRQLSSGRLPPYALVWRDGWGEWLPAMQVEELAEAFPEARALGTRTARPSSVPGVPPVPVSEYPRLRHLAKAAPLGWPDGFEGPEQEVITSEVPAAALIEAARVMTQPSPPRDLGLQEAIDRASRVPEDLTLYASFEEECSPPASRPALPLAAAYGLQGLLDEAAPQGSGSSWLRAHGLWVALAALTLGLGVTFALRHLGVPPARPAPLHPAAVDPLTTSQHSLLASRADGVEGRGLHAGAREPGPGDAARGCRVRHSPSSIDDWAVVDVRPLVFSPPGAAGVVVGYAQSHTSATGGLLDLESLQLTRHYWQQEERQIFSVTPLSGEDKPSYHVERMGSSMAFGRALDTKPPLRIGLNDDGLALGRLEQRSQKLWELPLGSRISVPEVVAHPRGFTLATRVGQSVGHLRLGLLDAQGAPRSALAALGPDDWDFGRPALASGPEQTLLAVTRRASAALPDAIFLARAANGQLPTALQPFEPPSDGDPELLAPVLAPLPDGGFALMWSQGAGSRRVVRLQRLSASLEPRGPALDLTSADPALGGSMSAALHGVGDRLLALYFVRRDAGHSLWALSLSCD
jgi:GYF domain 2